jgi:hypothetical protein
LNHFSLLSKSSFAVRNIIGVLIDSALSSFATSNHDLLGSITSKRKISYVFLNASFSQLSQSVFRVTIKLFSSKYSFIFSHMIRLSSIIKIFIV